MFALTNLISVMGGGGEPLIMDLWVGVSGSPFGGGLRGKPEVVVEEEEEGVE